MVRLAFNESNPWHIERILEPMPDVPHTATVMIFTPIACWLILFAALSASPQVFLCGLVISVLAFVNAPRGFRDCSASQHLKFFTASFALICLLMVPISLAVLLGFNKFGVVARSESIVAFEAVGILLGATSWCIWAFGYFVRGRSSAA